MVLFIPTQVKNYHISPKNLLLEDFNQSVVSSDATYPFPGFPQFTHTALNRLGLFHAGAIAQLPEMITATASVSESSSSRLDTF